MPGLTPDEGPPDEGTILSEVSDLAGTVCLQLHSDALGCFWLSGQYVSDCTSTGVAIEGHKLSLTSYLPPCLCMPQL